MAIKPVTMMSYSSRRRAATRLDSNQNCALLESAPNREGQQQLDRRPQIEASRAYVYAILVNGIIRYIGKGSGSRLFTHTRNAKRSAQKRGVRPSNLSPRFHRKLVEATRAEATVVERVIKSGLSDREAYRLEALIVACFHKLRPSQLWNTIDERFIDARWLPGHWDDPEHPLYRLPRPRCETMNKTARLRDSGKCLRHFRR